MAPKKKPDMAGFDKSVKEIGKCLVKSVQEEMGKGQWISAYLDIRGEEATDDCQLIKLRIVIPRGRIIKSVDPPIGVHVAISKIWHERHSVFSEKWFGLKVAVTPDGGCETEFNYDANCVMDPSFLDIE